MQIGSIKIDRPLVLAPMEDITDIPFRRMSRRLGADWVYTEFASSEALVRGQEKILKKVRIASDERPVGIQVFGSTPESLEEAVAVVEKFQPDFIDINGGCWSKRHALRGEGAGLLLDLPHLETILHRIVKATSLPVTFKTRLGWDEKKIVILDVAKMAEQAGIKALTVHCRTRCQGYKGQADWSWLEKIKKTISIPVIGNGDVRSAADAQRMFELGCDGVMIGRGAISDPWIFQKARHLLDKGSFLDEPTLTQRVEQCLVHLRFSIEHRGLRWGMVFFRKFYSGYFHGIPNVSKLRLELMQAQTFEAVQELLENFLRQHPSGISAAV